MSGTAQQQHDYDLLHEAVSRIKKVYEAAHYAPTLPSGSTDPSVPPNPANIPDLAPDGSLAIAGESLDYQLAVLLTQTEFNTQALGLGDSIDAARGDPSKQIENKRPFDTNDLHGRPLKTRRWRDGDVNPKPGNESTWRRAA